MFFGDFRPYVSAAERRKRAARHAAKLVKKGRAVRPIRIEGRTIAHSFWGKAWCDNLESYSDYANRMPRGRSYARNGSIVDLQIEPGRVAAIVSGSEIYDIAIDRLDRRLWRSLVRECTGRIGSLVELLQGRFSDDVMRILARPKNGLFPSPQQIRLACSCPDSADMCKHVAAALYGIGARLDAEPEIFFTLRQVDQAELVSEASTARRLRSRKSASKRTVASGDLESIFGIELERPRR
ncbi:MAG: SWIM zinc finger family protein [Myxococcales bacterium]|nr:SWIM zinc finger family protein [Myxococcales bacterium]